MGQDLRSRLFLSIRFHYFTLHMTWCNALNNFDIQDKGTCVGGDCTMIFHQLFHIEPRKAVIYFHCTMQSFVQIIGYVMARWAYSFLLFSLHTDTLLSLCVFTCKHKYINACQIYSADCVSKIKCIFLIIICAINLAVCFVLTFCSFYDCDIISCTSSYHHDEIGNMNHESCRKNSSINRTKSQNLNVSCILLHLSSFNPLKPGVKLRMKM